MTQSADEFDQAFEEAQGQQQQTPGARPAPPPPEDPPHEGADAADPKPPEASGPVAAAQPPADELSTLRAELAQTQHRERSSAHRVSVFAREANDLRQQMAQAQARIEELGRELAAAKTAAVKPPSPPPAADLADVLEDAPDLKAAVEGRIQRAVEAATAPLQDALRAANDRLAEVGQTATRAAQFVEPLAQREVQRETQSVVERLDKAFPDWQSTVRNPEFQQWIAGQTPEIQGMYRDARAFEPAAAVLKLFRADQAQRGAPAGAPNPTTRAAGSDQRLRQASGIAPRSASRLAPASDFEGAFAEFSAGQRKTR